MTTIKVLGQSNEKLKNVNFGEGLKNFSVSDAVQFTSDRASASYQVIEGLEDDDVVELIFEDDIHRWVTVSELEQEFKYQLARGEEPGVLEIPSQLPSGDTSRGATAWALTALRVLKYDPVAKTAEVIAKTWDAKLMPEPGLYRFSEKLNTRGKELNNPRVKKEKPILLFIHGTFSSTETGFGSLLPDIWIELKEKYGDQIFGYNHRTLSESPILNALDLVKKLPENSKLHLVTHSRGGLIGELLCRSGRRDRRKPFDVNDENLSDENKTALIELSNLLVSKKITVERFVRVACPARGTTLASNRIDRWLEIIVNVIAKVLPPGAGNIYGVIADLLLELKKQIANPDAMPGLAAMVPESNFIKMINRSDVEVDADLTVIAGDIEKNNLLGRLAMFFTDLFYIDEHDLVVQTPAMYGGSTRKAGRYFFDKGSAVNHFNYFSNRRTAEKIKEALTLQTDGLGKKGFRPIQEVFKNTAPDMSLRARSYQKRSNISQPIVYILPGIMGTHLSEGTDRIWLDLLSLTQGKMANLQVANMDVKPQALVALAYANLIDYLSATHEVIPFPYDWRLSILDEAERFANILDAKLKETDQPVRIVAHSMGGLVTRAMIGLRPELWDEICKREGARFVMLGTPSNGSYMIPRLIFGQEKTFRMLAMLDIKNSAKQLLEVISRFPGVLQLLPMEDSQWDFAEPSTWDKFPNTGGRRWAKPLQKDLEQVRNLQSLLSTEKGKIREQDPIVYVAGHAPGAPIAIEIAENQIVFRGTNQGDGTVPWTTGILPELKDGRTYYMDVPHGDLANHKESFTAIYDLLQDGITTRLPQVPPRFDRGEDDRYILHEDGVDIYPAQADLESAILGTAPIPPEVPLIKPVKVSVTHGNLSFCSNPVAVGHYEGDSLYSAEKFLDHHLNGRLSARHMLGLYPGPEGTVEVVLNDEGEKPGGAIIVGLGKAGELSPHKLSQSFASALREYGVKAVESGRVSDGGEITISTLLIGTGGMGLSVTNSVDALLTGVIQANKSFAQIADAQQADSHPNFNVRISEIQFIELFKDQAILAARALEPFLKKKEFAVNPLLQNLRGGWHRIAYDEPAGWWNRIYIRAGSNGDNSLIFSVPTDRARSEESQLGVQRRNIDRLIAQAVRNPNWDQNLATTMFELMIPNRLKGSFKDMNDVLFVVDKESASYPWELLYDRRTGQDLPMVVQVGMVRQFSTSSFQEKVVDVKNKNILVVGNPANTPANFSNLPGAEQEANLVAYKFEENNYQVRRAIHTDSSTIMNDLFSKDYRVLHLAGHGVYNYSYKHSEEDEPELFTGMVLGEGVFLTANEIKNKMHIPELVFINCCHLGKLSASNEEDRTPKYAFNEFAASLSQELIEMGVKAVVAAGWAVDDTAASTFAEIFYDRLLKGYRFGDAVKEARVETYHLHKDRTNTWAAYQCYGDPAYRLTVNTGGAQRTEEMFVDIDEVIVRINQLYEKAKTASAQGIRQYKDDLNNLQEKISNENPAWLTNGRLLEAFGEAFGEVFWFEEAVKYYDQAIENRKSTASIRAIEQSVNCHIRLAVQECENDPSQYQKSKSAIEEHIKKLNQLMVMAGNTGERLSMIGSGYKRLAQISSNKTSKVCNSALQKMEDSYHQAWKTEESNPYPLTNTLVAITVQLLRSSETERLNYNLPEIKELTEKAKRLADMNKTTSPDDFWATVGITDVKLLVYLTEYLNKENIFNDIMHDELFKEYSIAWKQYGSARELNSVIEHYSFLVAVLNKLDTHKNLWTVLEKILLSLKSMSEEVG